MVVRNRRAYAQPRQTGPALTTAIVGLFDEAAAARIKALRARVGGDASFAPHLTFAVHDGLAPEAAAARIDQAPASPAIRLRFTAIGAFPASGVLHLAPAASAALSSLHATLHQAIGGDSRPNFRPGEWTPHCTLASGLDSAALGAGTAALAADFAAFEATLVALAVVESPPPRVHRRRMLGARR